MQTVFSMSQALNFSFIQSLFLNNLDGKRQKKAITVLYSNAKSQQISCFVLAAGVLTGVSDLLLKRTSLDCEGVATFSNI
jgi:hypothetical protein